MVTATKPRTGARRKQGPDLAVVLQDVPPGCDWGWYAREDPRMHLQTVDREHQNQYKVWLEEKGKAAFIPAGPIPAKILKKIRAEVIEKKTSIEAEWVHFMIKLGWLTCVARPPYVTLTAYPRTPNRFERTIDLSEHLGPELSAQLKPTDIALNAEYAVIEIWPHKPIARRPFIQLAPLLWPA